MVVAQQSTEPLVALDRAVGVVVGGRLDELAVEALMWAPGVIVGELLAHGGTQVLLAEEYQKIEALAF